MEIEDNTQDKKYMENDLFNKVNPKTSNREVGSIQIE